MIKHITIALVLVIGLSGLGSAGVTQTYNFDGDGTPSYPNSGWISIKYTGSGSGGASSTYVSTYTDSYYTYASGHACAWRLNPELGWSAYAFSDYNEHNSSGGLHTVLYRMAVADSSGGGSSSGDSGHVSFTYPVSGNNAKFSQLGVDKTSMTNAGISITASVRISTTPILLYNISGDTECIYNVTLYSNLTGTYHTENYTLLSDSGDSYSFIIVNGEKYKLVFSDGHEYEFTCTGANITYNYDACIHTEYRFEESCGNLIPDSEGFYIEKVGTVVHAANNFYEPSGILDISQSPADNIYVSANPFSGQMGWFLDPVVNDTTYTLTNPVISWSLKVIVQNESTGALINNAMVKVNQSCYCTDQYSVRQKLTTNGRADFTDMSLQDADLFITKTGYKILDESSTGYSAFLSGRSNFSSKTWVVKLAPSWSENESTFYESNNTVNIFFKNEDGNRTSKILDTDSEVYLYYKNNNADEEDMTLKFQSSSTHTHFIDEQSYNIPHGEIGHKTIVNADFTPWNYSYRAVIYNSSIHGWNITIPLTVRNATKESGQHYENLSSSLWFMYASDGKIDYRADMDIGVHACSNNTTLMYVDIELYKDNVLLCYKNMTPSNFINADFPYYYVWSPAYSYESGSNYSVRMYGFDRTLLETDYIDCYTDDVTRKNKLTIIVKNHYGTNLDNAFVLLGDYGSIPTGSNYYASFEGLDNGYYRYKATKPDYTGTGWDDITLSDNDEIVTYVLTSTASEEGSATQPQKMDENELQNIYLIIMAFVLIFIIIGGLRYAL